MNNSYCQNCGQYYFGYHTCPLNQSGTSGPIYQSPHTYHTHTHLPEECKHCYCEELLVKKIRHKKCCNCGNKQKI